MAPLLATTGFSTSGFLAAAACGLVWMVIFRQRLSHTVRWDWGYLTEMEELQAPISDCAFYLSYYYDVARAPSLGEGLQRLLHDERSEAPDVVNALHKFNVVPELVVAAAHKVAAQFGFVESAWAFYVRSLLGFSGLGIFGLAFSAALLGGGSMLSAISATVLYFGICFSPAMHAGTRLVSGAQVLALREHWGVPALLLQNAALIAVLRSRPRAARYFALLLLAVLTCIFELAWQFAPFVLLLQMLSLLGATGLCCLPRWHMGEAAAAAAAGTLGALAMSFGNRMLLCSPFFALAISMSLVGFAPAPTMLVGKAPFAEAVWVGLAAVVVGGISQQILAAQVSQEEASHVLQLLLQKLGLAAKDASFDAFLYLQDPEFGFLSERYAREAISVGLLPASGAALVLWLVAVMRRKFLPWLRPAGASPAPAPVSSNTKKKAQDKTQNRKGNNNAGTRQPSASDDAADDAPWAAWAVQLLFAVALVLLACLVNRLRVLAAPALAIVASLAGSPELWREAIVRWRGIAAVAHLASLALVVWPLYYSETIDRAVQVGQFNWDKDMRELVDWANETMPSGSFFMADMTMAAKFRLINPQISVVNHPQYESKTSRKRNRDYYITFTCASPEKVHQVLSQYNVTYVLLNANACRARIGKLDAFHGEAEKCGAASAQELQARTFCYGGFLRQKTSLFKLEFRNPVYTVLRLQDASTATTPWKGQETPRIGSAATWKPWLKGLHGKGAARAIARAAVDWPRRYGGRDVSEAMLKKAEDLAPDDPLVRLQKGLLVKDSSPSQAETFFGEAAKLSADVDAPTQIFEVFVAWKDLLASKKSNMKKVETLSRQMLPHLVATRNAFDMCDVASILQGWGSRDRITSELWSAAKNASKYDSCVREDWKNWEGHELSVSDTRRIFLGL
eukprot:TRINITY_DN55705_c0_g1_i1.p1 TRINITY_DN55705_c0_g1~~TRINITY_DN55705_c0_g1_i1.p1  ORF type:complete len:909 (-),score=199.11 TRINITY_DN55705_c0_g1_i1:41-2767(-)